MAVASHAHVDHIGGLHEFADGLGHAAKAAGFAGLPGVENFTKGFRTWPDVASPLPAAGWTNAADFFCPAMQSMTTRSWTSCRGQASPTIWPR